MSEDDCCACVHACTWHSAARPRTPQERRACSGCTLLPCVQVNLLQAEHNADMMLLAARALTFLADVMPASAAAIVRHGAVQVQIATSCVFS